MVNPEGGIFPGPGEALGELWELWGRSGSSGGALGEEHIGFTEETLGKL